jgi:hypothetical protein
MSACDVAAGTIPGTATVTPGEIRAAFYDAFLTRAHALYVETGNPVHAMYAFRLARHFDQAPAPWVMEAVTQLFASEIPIGVRDRKNATEADRQLGIAAMVASLRIRLAEGLPDWIDKPEHAQLRRELKALHHELTLNTPEAIVAERCGLSVDHVRTIFRRFVKIADLAN